MIIHHKNGLSKMIHTEYYSPADLNIIYRFYTEHKDFWIEIDGTADDQV